MTKLRQYCIFEIGYESSLYLTWTFRIKKINCILIEILPICVITRLDKIKYYTDGTIILQ